MWVFFPTLLGFLEVLVGLLPWPSGARTALCSLERQGEWCLFYRQEKQKKYKYDFTVTFLENTRCVSK